MMRTDFGLLTKNGFKQTATGAVQAYSLSTAQKKAAIAYLKSKKIDGAATVKIDYYAVKLDGSNTYNGCNAYVQLWDRDSHRLHDCDNYALPVAKW